MTQPRLTSSLSINQIRNLIILILIVVVTAYTAVMFLLAQRLSQYLGPQVQVDLEWRAQRGAQELSRAAELGLVLSDTQVVMEAFGAYAHSDDVQAIVAVDAHDRVVAQLGKSPEPLGKLFSGGPGSLRAEPGYLVSWAAAKGEGAPVGKVAIVVSTARLHEADALLQRSLTTTLLGGAARILLGVLVVVFFTRAVAQRDAQLSNYASNLERKVEQRTRELDERTQGMRLVLDNVAQGFITLSVADGVMASERSAIVERWFGTAPADATLSNYLGKHAPEFATWMDLGLDQLRDGSMPAELVLDQLPTRLRAAERTYDVAYTPLNATAEPDRLLVIVSDVTERLARERSEAEQKELVALFQRVTVDRSGVEEFVAEAAQLVGALREERDPGTEKRLIHTLKGICAMYGLPSIAELAHRMESELAETGATLSDAQRSCLVGAWKHSVQRVGSLLSGARRDNVEIDRAQLYALIDRLGKDANPLELSSVLMSWTREPVVGRLERLGSQARALARRLNKPEPQIVIDDHNLRLDVGPWSAFFVALIHVVRNGVDHGLEDALDRALVGKAETGTLWFSAQRAGSQITIAIRDDGRGVDWSKVRAKAVKLGLPSSSDTDLVGALFADGISTRDQVSEVSGRGMGLGAVNQAVRELGGRIDVDSTAGKGTTFTFTFEEQQAASAKLARTVNSSLMPTLS